MPRSSGKSAGIATTPFSTGVSDSFSGSGVMLVVEHGSAEKTHIAARVVSDWSTRICVARLIASSPPAEP